MGSSRGQTASRKRRSSSIQFVEKFLKQGQQGRLAGLLLGLASMYWYAYQKDAFIDSVKDWFADASADPGAREKLDKMISRK